MYICIYIYIYIYDTTVIILHNICNNIVLRQRVHALAEAARVAPHPLVPPARPSISTSIIIITIMCRTEHY